MYHVPNKALAPHKIVVIVVTTCAFFVFVLYIEHEHGLEEQGRSCVHRNYLGQQVDVLTLVPHSMYLIHAFVGETRL